MQLAIGLSSSIHYSSLDISKQDIRLLILQPSTDFSAPLRATVFTACIQGHATQYQALSYVWGDSTIVEDIFLDASLDAVKIGHNLALAFRYIRHRSESMTLWADALCINQRDVTEREHQVRMMASIYHNARNVIAWIGEEANDSGLAFNVIRTWATPCRRVLYEEPQGPVRPAR
jgi:hypothetical protein